MQPSPAFAHSQPASPTIPGGALFQELMGEALIHQAHGGRVLDLGCGSPLISEWIQQFCSDWSFVHPQDLQLPEMATLHLPYPDNSFDLVYCLKTLPYVGQDEASSQHVIRELLREAARVVIPGGYVMVEIDNPYSLRGIIHGIRHPITIVREGHVISEESRRVHRYDSLANLIHLSPTNLDMVGFHGIRIFVPFTALLALPLLRSLFTMLEWFGRDHSLLRRFGAQLLVIFRKFEGEKTSS